jgi:hypothetical protein
MMSVSDPPLYEGLNVRVTDRSVGLYWLVIRLAMVDRPVALSEVCAYQVRVLLSVWQKRLLVFWPPSVQFQFVFEVLNMLSMWVWTPVSAADALPPAMPATAATMTPMTALHRRVRRTGFLAPAPLVASRLTKAISASQNWCTSIVLTVGEHYARLNDRELGFP